MKQVEMTAEKKQLITFKKPKLSAISVSFYFITHLKNYVLRRPTALHGKIKMKKQIHFFSSFFFVFWLSAKSSLRQSEQKQQSDSIGSFFLSRFFLFQENKCFEIFKRCTRSFGNRLCASAYNK